MCNCKPKCHDNNCGNTHIEAISSSHRTKCCKPKCCDTNCRNSHTETNNSSIRESANRLDFLAAMAISSSKCTPSGNTGTPGPTGPQGLQGIPGPQGIQGIPGIDGYCLPGLQGIPGLPGADGYIGPQGIPGIPGLPGVDGYIGPIGPIGLPGLPGIDGYNGLNGLPGRDGYIGPIGATGHIGPIGPVGATGPIGPIGPIGSGVGTISFAWFYGKASTNYSEPISAGSPLDFPNLGPTSGLGITRSGVGQFLLLLAGVYEIFWQASITGAAQLMLRINGVLQGQTVSSRSTGTSQLINSVLISVAANSTLEVINPPGNSTAILITPANGSLTHEPATSLVIKKLT